MLKFGVLVLSSFFTINAYAQFNGKLELSARSKPFQYTGQLTGAYDGLLWGAADKTHGKYGFYRAGLRAGGSPTAAVFLQIAPIAPVVFEAQQGTTYRFFKSSPTDCGTYECLHWVDRTDYSVKIGGALKSFVLMSKFTWRDVTPESGTKIIFLEAEMFHVTPGRTYHYFENTTLAGYQLDERQTAGLLYNSGELAGSGGARFYSGYAVYIRKMDWADLTAGLGYYENSAVPAEVRDKLKGISALVQLSRTFGDSLTLF